MAAFSLEPTGPPAPCGFPGCIGEAFHEGEHEFAQPKTAFFASPPPPSMPHYTCGGCGMQFVGYGATLHTKRQTCGSPACLLALCRREAVPQPLMCGCPQRPYPHELVIHRNLRREAYDRTRRYSWPWSLALSARLEPSTET